MKLINLELFFAIFLRYFLNICGEFNLLISQKQSDTNRGKFSTGYEIDPVQMCVKISMQLVDSENIINWNIQKN